MGNEGGVGWGGVGNEGGWGGVGWVSGWVVGWGGGWGRGACRDGWETAGLREACTPTLRRLLASCPCRRPSAARS